MSNDNTNTTAMTPGMEQTQNAISFINQSVLQPDVKPIAGTASPMIDQATGMMVQDLQIFLKGFEQIGLVAIARLADNVLTYGTISHDDKTSANKTSPSNDKGKDAKAPEDTSKKTAIKELFSLVSDYGKMKAEISSMIKTANTDIKLLNTDVEAITKDLKNKHEASAEKKNLIVTENKVPPSVAKAEAVFEPLDTTKNDMETTENLEDAVQEDDNQDTEDDVKDDVKSDDSKKKTYWFSRKK